VKRRLPLVGRVARQELVEEPPRVRRVQPAGATFCASADWSRAANTKQRRGRQHDAGRRPHDERDDHRCAQPQRERAQDDRQRALRTRPMTSSAARLEL
jgi:hypothetical protein